MQKEMTARAGTTVLKVFNTDIFTGVSVETTAQNEDTLKAINDVKNVWLANKITLAQPLKGQSYSDDAAAKDYDIHSMTGVDKLHAAGITGKGAVVAIVDTGTYYTHPAVKYLGFGPNCLEG